MKRHSVKSKKILGNNTKISSYFTPITDDVGGSQLMLSPVLTKRRIVNSDTKRNNIIINLVESDDDDDIRKRQLNNELRNAIAGCSKSKYLNTDVVDTTSKNKPLSEQNNTNTSPIFKKFKYDIQNCDLVYSDTEVLIKQNVLQKSIPISEIENENNIKHVINLTNDELEVCQSNINLDSNELPTIKCKPFSKMQNVSNHKTPEKMQRTPTKQKSSEKKTSRTKLFIKSPKSLDKFNVDVVKNFVQVTPSKSKEIIALSPRSSDAQNKNETTPTKVSIKAEPSSNIEKVKAKLSFDDINNKVEVEPHIEFWSDEGYNMETADLHELDLNESQHCVVLDVTREQVSVKISVQCTKTKAKAYCILQGIWIELQLMVNDIIHICAKYDNEKCIWCVNNEFGLIVYQPDTLLATTSIVGASYCRRRAIFSERAYSYKPINRYFIVGILVHELLEKVVKEKSYSYNEIENIAKNLMSKNTTTKMLYKSNLKEEDIKDSFWIYIPKIIAFIHQYVQPLDNSPQFGSYNNNNWKKTIDEIDDIEENIWSPELGLKGKIDVSIVSSGTKLPLELKSGNATMSLDHRAQIMLYVMMFRKLGIEVNSGLLLYLKDGILKEISLTRPEERDLMFLRNELVYYLARKPKFENKSDESTSNKQNSYQLTVSELPEPLTSNHICSKCDYKIICSAYLRYEDYDLNNDSAKNFRTETLAHLEPQHIEYVVKWSMLLTLEASTPGTGKHLRHIYTIPPKLRKNGLCIIDLKIKDMAVNDNGTHNYIFEKVDNTRNLHPTTITVSDYIVISTNKRPAVAMGFVNQIDNKTITISVTSNLNKRHLSSTFHIDTYESSSSQIFIMHCLTLLLETTEKAKKLRKLIIDKQPPTFTTKLSSSVVTKAKPILKQLNKFQQKAILKALAVQDYLLIKGMPGTGKTATIVSLVQLMYQLNKTVLITSHTHAAIDNVCERLINCGVKLLRLGAHGKINPKLHPYSEASLIRDYKTVEELNVLYNKFNIVAVTCLGSGHALLSNREFDMCIIDESTQIIQTSSFRAIFSSKKFILVGDPNQLPPLIKNELASNYGLSESLFERLDLPHATVNLVLNYRMNQPITAMANAFTYNGNLLVGNNDVANATIHIPELEKFNSLNKNKPWILKVFDQSLSASIRILDTGPINKKVSVNKIDKLKNPWEIGVTLTLVNALLEAGVSGSAIGVITLHRAQMLELQFNLTGKAVDVSTVDRFQGKDKEIIIYSCVRWFKDSELKNNQLNLLESKCRLNVAITRAKHKFILIGDLSIIQFYSTISKLLDCIDKDCFIELKDGHLGFSWKDVMLSYTATCDEC